MANPIVENLDNTDTRELPTERGPRGVDIEVTPAPRVGSELAQQELSRAEEGAARALESRPSVGGIPDAQLTPISVNNPVLDPNTYSNAFTREAQDQATALSNLSGGSVPVYAGSTYAFPDTTPPANTLMGEFRASDFLPDAPSGRAGGRSGQASGTFLRTAFDHYTDPAYQERTELQASGLDADSPTTNALQQAGSGIQGVFSLARRGITSLFRASQASGASVVGAPTANDSGATRAAKNVGGFLLGGPALALLNSDARRAYFETLQNEWSGLGENEREALRQISPTSGAGQAGTRGPLQGDFGEYGTNLLGGVQYVIDGLGNQARANIAARIETGNLFNPIPWTERGKEFGAVARRNALAAWRGKEFSFLNPDGELGLVGDQYYNPEGTRAERLASRVSLPFRLGAGIALDTLTGPDPMDMLGQLRRTLGKGAKAAKAAQASASAPTTAGALAKRPVVTVYPESIPGPAPRLSPQGALARDTITVDPQPIPRGLMARGLPSAGPPPRALPGTAQQPLLPPSGGVDISALFPVVPNSPILDDVRVLPQLPDVGTPDLSPNLRRPRRLVSDELGTALDEATADLPTLDLTTGRVSPVVEPDLDAVAPPRIASFDDIEPVEWGSPASQRTSRDSIQFGLQQRAPRGPLETLSEEPRSDSVSNVRPNINAAEETLDLARPAPTLDATESLAPALNAVPDEVVDILDTIPKQYEDMSLEELFAEVDRIGAKYDDVPAEAVADLDAARRARDLLRDAGWDDLAASGQQKISALRTRGPIGVVRDTPGSVVQGNFPDRPIADVVDIFTKHVREAPAQALEDVDLSRKVLEHATAAGTALVTNRGAVVRADEFLGAGARQIADLQNKADLARQAGRADVAAQHEAVINAIRGSAKNNPVSPPTRSDVLTPDEVDELVPPVTVEQLTPNRRADQAVRELGSTNLLDQAFDLKAIERSNLVTRTRGELEALARWMGHVNPDEHLTWKRLRQLHEQHGLYNAYGPKVNKFELDRARRNGVRRVQQVEPNPLLNVPGQSTIIASTPQVLKNQFNKAAVTEQNLIGQDEVLALLKGKPLTDDTVERLVKTWVNSPGKSSTRRNLNTVLGGGGYQYTPDQIATLKNTYGALPKKQQAKLPKGLRDILRDELPRDVRQAFPLPRGGVDTPETPLSELLEPGVSAKQLRATSVPSELRSASDETLAAFVETRSRALDTRQAIVELESDLAMVEAEQARIYQDLAELPELEPRSVMNGTWESGRVNERVETVLEVLDAPINRRADDPPFTGSMVNVESVTDDLYYGSPFLGGVGNPRALPLGSSNPLRGAYPPGFAVITNDPKLARALAQGRVPDNTVLGPLTPNPAVDKVYLAPDGIVLDGNAPLPPVEYERLLVKLSEFIDPFDRDTLRAILKKVPDLKDAPLGRIMERLQEGWVKAYPNKAPNDLLFAALGSGYREYVGRNGDAVLLNLPGGRQVLLTPSPERALAEQFQRTSASVLLPSDAALHRAYADEVLAERGRALSQVLGKNNRNQHAIELTQELTDELNTLDNQLDELLDAESALKKEAADLTEKEALEQSARRELAQSKRVEAEFDDVLNNSSTDPGCL